MVYLAVEEVDTTDRARWTGQPGPVHDSMMILVAGGTGRLGTVLVDDLRRRGHEVRVLARGHVDAPPTWQDVEVVTGSVTDPRAVERAVDGVDLVVSAVTGFPGADPMAVDLPGTDTLRRAAERAGAEVVMVSVADAAPDSPMALSRAKHAAEQALRRSSVRGTVVRADGFADLWIELLVTTAGRSRRPLVFGRGDNPFGWVAVRDVAALVQRVVDEPSLRGGTLTILGPERRTLHQLAEQVMLAHGWAGEPRHLPVPVLRAMSLLPGRGGRQAAAALAMDRMAPASDDARPRVPGLPCTYVEDLLAERVGRG